MKLSKYLRATSKEVFSCTLDSNDIVVSVGRVSPLKYTFGSQKLSNVFIIDFIEEHLKMTKK